MDKSQQYFLAIAQSGSFKKASEHLSVSQPSLTVAIKKLENNMGVTLFHRHAKGIELTEYGILLKQHVLEQQEKQLHLMHQIEDMKQKVHGKIKLGTGEAWWELLVREVVARYQQSQPDSSFHLEFGNNQTLIHHLVKGELDLVVGHELAGLAEQTRVTFHPMFQDHEAIYVADDHPLLSADDTQQPLQQFPLIRVTPSHQRHQAVLSAESTRQNIISQQERTFNRVCYDIDSLTASIDMLKMSQAIMPYTDKLANWLGQRGVTTLSVNRQKIGNIGIYTKNGISSEKIELFINLLQQAVQRWGSSLSSSDSSHRQQGA